MIDKLFDGKDSNYYNTLNNYQTYQNKYELPSNPIAPVANTNNFDYKPLNYNILETSKNYTSYNPLN